MVDSLWGTRTPLQQPMHSHWGHASWYPSWKGWPCHGAWRDSSGSGGGCRAGGRTGSWGLRSRGSWLWRRGGSAPRGGCRGFFFSCCKYRGIGIRPTIHVAWKPTQESSFGRGYERGPYKIVNCHISTDPALPRDCGELVCMTWDHRLNLTEHV
jgi:hypothetical protein